MTLLENHFDPNQVILWCVKKNLKDIVYLLMESGKITGENIDLAFQLASLLRKISIMKFLLRYFKIEPTTFCLSTFFLAIEKGNYEIIKLIASNKRFRSLFNIEFIIHCASKYGHDHIIAKLLTIKKIYNSSSIYPGLSFYFYESKALIIACKKGYEKIVELLLCDGRIDPRIENYRALDEACKKNHLCIVELLLNDARVEPIKSNAISIATQLRHFDIIKLLLKEKKIPVFHLHSIMLEAIESNNVEIIELLLDDPRYELTFDHPFFLVNVSIIFSSVLVYNRINLFTLFINHPKIDPSLLIGYSLDSLEHLELLLHHPRIDQIKKNEIFERFFKKHKRNLRKYINYPNDSKLTYCNIL